MAVLSITILLSTGCGADGDDMVPVEQQTAGICHGEGCSDPGSLTRPPPPPVDLCRNEQPCAGGGKISCEATAGASNRCYGGSYDPLFVGVGTGKGKRKKVKYVECVSWDKNGNEIYRDHSICPEE